MYVTNLKVGVGTYTCSTLWLDISNMYRLVYIYQPIRLVEQTNVGVVVLLFLWRELNLCLTKGCGSSRTPYSHLLGRLVVLIVVLLFISRELIRGALVVSTPLSRGLTYTSTLYLSKGCLYRYSSNHRIRIIGFSLFVCGGWVWFYYNTLRPPLWEGKC